MIGKLSPDDLRGTVFERLGADSDALVQGPAYGEDAAAIRIGEELLVVSSDPVSLAAERVGTIGVHVACNDVAVSGAEPEWLTVVAFVPDDRPDVIEAVTRQLDAAATDLGVSIVGGHTEYSAALDRPTLSLTAMGTADRFVATGGAEHGDRVLLTTGAGIEGTAILATDFREAMVETVGPDLVDEAASFFDDLSVLPEARLLRERATAMHDPTEGGLIDGLLELAAASGVDLHVDRDAVPIREPTRRLCAAADVDPLAIFGSGALAATVPEADAADALAALRDAGITAADVGAVTDGTEGRDGAERVEGTEKTGRLHIDGDVIERPIRDDLYDLWT